jgi:predicted membrane-bound mannosyltransferase
MPATQQPLSREATTATRWAWWSLLGFVPSFVLAFAVGEGLISALGYPSGGSEQAPWWAALTASVPALVVFALPAVAAVHFGRRAIRLGDDRGRVPMVVALAGAGVFVLMNGLSALTIWLS